MVDVVEARYVRDYTVWLRFEDGAEGEVDLSAELHGPVFEPLRDLAYFRHFAVSADLGNYLVAERRRLRARVPVRQTSRARLTRGCRRTRGAGFARTSSPLSRKPLGG